MIKKSGHGEKFYSMFIREDFLEEMNVLRKPMMHFLHFVKLAGLEVPPNIILGPIPPAGWIEREKKSWTSTAHDCNEPTTFTSIKTHFGEHTSTQHTHVRCVT